MIWRDEQYRKACVSGELCVGAIYPPTAAQRLWRWRIWVTASGSENKGLSGSEMQARGNVESRFRRFLDVAQLVQEGGVE